MKHALICFSALLTLAVQLQAQSIVTIVANSAQQGDYLSVTVTGSGTSFLSGMPTLQLAQGATTIQATNILASSNTVLTADFYIPLAAPSGLYHVIVSGVAPKLNAFTVNFNTKYVQSITANSSQQYELVSVAITGFGTSFGSGPITEVRLINATDTLLASNVSVTNATQLTADIDIPYNAALGFYDVNVTSCVPLPNGFTVTTNLKKVVAIAAAIGGAGESLTVTITGSTTNFTTATANSVTLSMGGDTIAASNINILSTTLLTADLAIPSAAVLGQYDVRVGFYAPLNGGFTIVDATDVKENRATETMSIFPVPVNSGSVVSFELNEKESISLAISDVTGREVYRRPPENLGAGKHQINLWGDHFSAPGVYLVQLQVGQSIHTKRVIY